MVGTNTGRKAGGSSEALFFQPKTALRERCERRKNSTYTPTGIARQGRHRHPLIATLNGTIILDRVQNMTRRRWDFGLM
ncbi:hypothetical protein FJTKL_05460 [Diaporthe vaccinii]|uniref:Uncharacterized protein n=1 Tax=Diaporthe vaccinii TaxID=105482 RepID=A0ABR4FFX2_9PEZI